MAGDIYVTTDIISGQYVSSSRSIEERSIEHPGLLKRGKLSAASEKHARAASMHAVTEGRMAGTLPGTAGCLFGDGGILPSHTRL